MAKYKEHIEQSDKTKVVVLPEKVYSKNPLDYLQSPLKFVNDYYNSEGFKQRFHNYKQIYRNFSGTKYDPENIFNQLLKITKYPLKLKKVKVSDERLNENAEYDGKTFTITMGKHHNPKSYSDVFAHELGHAVDRSIKIERGKTYDYLGPQYSSTTSRYSEIFPIFRKSKSYQKFSDNLKDPTYWHQYPGQYYELEHDGQPSESYADLMALRYLAHKFFIYDSTKKNHPFTQEHLDQLKTKVPYFRLFENFDDEDIIEMMNTVAQNENKSNNSNKTYYAQKGMIFPKNTTTTRTFYLGNKILNNNKKLHKKGIIVGYT